ncbi:MAG: hypothetical protein QNJ34_16650 [Xenococcaceae cyanobacterium MO_188.B29]|nr:hypothetical protein [Xenococcaceae cyanobacterium MO_188.B29]
MREIVQSEVKARAEAKIPGYEEGQKNMPSSIELTSITGVMVG